MQNPSAETKSSVTDPTELPQQLRCRAASCRRRRVGRAACRNGRNGYRQGSNASIHAASRATAIALSCRSSGRTHPRPPPEGLRPASPGSPRIRRSHFIASPPCRVHLPYRKASFSLGSVKCGLQHGNVRQERRILEIFGVSRTLPHAGLALDAGAGNAAHVLGIDGPHGAYSGAGTAVRASGKIGQWLGFQEFGRLSVRSLGGIIGGGCIAGNGNRRPEYLSG